MSNILLVNDNVQDYQTIIDACKDNTYAVTYNQETDTYDSIFKKYENLVLENNIQLVNHLALVSHGSNNPEFTFLEKENKMLISQYLPDLTEDKDLSLNNIDELYDKRLNFNKYIVDLSLNLTPEEFDTGKTYTSEEILYIFKDTSCNAFDIVSSLPDISDSNAAYSINYIHLLVEDVYYDKTNTLRDEKFENATTDLNVNSVDVHKYIVDLSLNITNEEFNTKETYTYEEVIYIFKDLSYNVFDEFAAFSDISSSIEIYTKPYVYELIKYTYYAITDTSENIDVLTGYILNTLNTWSSFKEFIKKFNIQKSLDFLGCALLQSSDWKYTLDTLESEQHLHLNIRASDDNTGNLKVGADWVLETDNVNIKELYFNGESIEKWYYTLSVWPTTSLTVPQTNIKFSELYVALLNNGSVPSSYSNISFTSIRNTPTHPLTGNAIPSHPNQISIGTHFKGRGFYRRLSATGGSTLVKNGKKFHTFTSSGNFNITSGGPDTLYYLIVGGGGGGGDRHGGGGGGGGVLAGTQSGASGGQSYTVTVGVGGAGGNYETYNSSPRGSGLKGGNSSVSSIGTAYGGGGGGTYDGNPSHSPVGSGGGGGGRNRSGVSGTSGQGYSGGSGRNPGGGGGGGAGGTGW